MRQRSSEEPPSRNRPASCVATCACRISFHPRTGTEACEKSSCRCASPCPGPDMGISTKSGRSSISGRPVFSSVGIELDGATAPVGDARPLLHDEIDAFVVGLEDLVARHPGIDHHNIDLARLVIAVMIPSLTGPCRHGRMRTN